MKNLFYPSKTLITPLGIFVIRKCFVVGKCSNQDEFLILERRSKLNPKTKRYQKKKKKKIKSLETNIVI